jgi:nucleotide-binding universal stress UspA family protein
VAKDLAKQYGTKILLLHVVPVFPRLLDTIAILHEGEYEQELIRRAERRLQELAGQLEQAGVRASTRVGLANDAAMEIVREAELADLIVIATHGMTGWRRLAFRSVTEKVARTANCPCSSCAPSLPPSHTTAKQSPLPRANSMGKPAVCKRH